MSKAKGSSFERLVASLVLKAFPGFTKKDCYRTPLSGGHPYGDSGDLVLGDRLRRVFPFCVECKHTKLWTLHRVMSGSSMFIGWLKQAIRSAEASPAGDRPLLVMQGNRTDIFCAVQFSALALAGRTGKFLKKAAPFIYLVIRDSRIEGGVWCIMRFSDFLNLWRKE